MPDRPKCPFCGSFNTGLAAGGTLQIYYCLDCYSTFNPRKQDTDPPPPKPTEK